jgi:hypothetical protein
MSNTETFVVVWKENMLKTFKFTFVKIFICPVYRRACGSVFRCRLHLKYITHVHFVGGLVDRVRLECGYSYMSEIECL